LLVPRTIPCLRWGEAVQIETVEVVERDLSGRRCTIRDGMSSFTSAAMISGQKANQAP
jgi:hypothetical protein